MAQGGSLEANVYVDLVAFILSRNDLPAGAEELTRDSAKGIQIITKDGPGRTSKRHFSQRRRLSRSQGGRRVDAQHGHSGRAAAGQNPIRMMRPAHWERAATSSCTY